MPIEEIVYHRNNCCGVQVVELHGIVVDQVGLVDDTYLEPVGSFAVLGEAVVEQTEVVVLRIVSRHWDDP
jgi:hypothetical protein